MATNTSAAKRGFIYDKANSRLALYVDGSAAGNFSSSAANFPGTIGSTGALTVTAGGLTVTAGGLLVSACGITSTGDVVLNCLANGDCACAPLSGTVTVVCVCCALTLTLVPPC